MRTARLEVRTPSGVAFVEITGRLEAVLAESGVRDGLCVVYVPHTTAGVTINENADPSVVRDIIRGLEKAVPDGASYEHAEGNSPAHIKASLVGCSLSIPVEEGRLSLGTWQGVYLCEFDGPRTRRVVVKVLEG